MDGPFRAHSTGGESVSALAVQVLIVDYHESAEDHCVKKCVKDIQALTSVIAEFREVTCFRELLPIAERWTGNLTGWEGCFGFEAESLGGLLSSAPMTESASDREVEATAVETISSSQTRVRENQGRLLIGVPIHAGNRVVRGAIVVLFDSQAASLDESHALLDTFGATASFALEHSGARIEKGHAEREYSLLQKTGRALVLSLDPERVLHDVLEIVRDELGVTRCAVLLIDGKTRELVVRKAVGYGVQQGTAIPMDRGITTRVTQRGVAEIVSDVLLDPDYVSGVPGGRSEMAAPLLLGEEVIGVIDVESTEADAFRERELRILEMLAVQLASAVRNAELHEQVQRRARRMSLINEAGRALTEVMVPDVLLGKILRLARDALSFSHCAIALRDKQSGDLLVRAAVGYGEIIGKRIPAGQGVSAEVVRTGRPLLVPDVLRDERYVPGVVGGRTEMVAPIITDGEVIGTVDAESPEVNAYDEEDLELLAAFAAQAGTALRNARLLDKLEQRGARLAVIHRVSQTLATVLDPDQVLDEILRLARGALAFSRSAIVLVDHENQDLVVRAALGYGDVIGKRLPLQGSVTGTVVQTGEPLLVPDVNEDPRYIEGSIGAACEMAAPLRVRGEVIGVIDAESERIGWFGESDLELLSVFAVHAATAIHNARLFRRLEEANHALRASLREMERLNQELESSARQIRDNNLMLERQVQQLRALHRAGKAMTATLDLDQTLDAILAMTRDIISTSAGTIKLLDEESQEMCVRASAGTMPEPEKRVDVPLRVGDRVIGVFELGTLQKLGDEERRLLETMASQAAVAIENARLFEDTQRTYYETLRSLASALEARDAYTRGHSERVARISLLVATKLGLAEESRREIYSAAMLHDIGKIGVRDEILLKPARLTEPEMDVIRSHPALGDTILGPLKFLGRVARLVKHHHERWDGGGYPDGLSGDAIPLPSRIVAVADTYDALTTDRPYRRRMSHATALEEISANAGTQFDPAVVDALIAAIGDQGEGR